MADLVATLVQDVYIDLMLSPLREAGEQRCQLPVPVGPVSGTPAGRIHTIYRAKPCSPLPCPLADMFAERMPGPMFAGNQESHNMACATGLDFRAAVVSHEDW